MILREKLYTVEDFREIARPSENETKRLELVDGVIFEVPMSSPLESVNACRICYFIN